MLNHEELQALYRRESPEKMGGPAPAKEADGRLIWSVAKVLRTRYGLTQSALSKLTNTTPADLSEMENHPPYGQMDKYVRVAEYYNIPVEALVKNDLRAIPQGMLHVPELKYKAAPKDPEQCAWRQGEELALRMEKERLSRFWPALTELPIPYFKMKGASPGYDILTFDNYAHPVCMEVKTAAPGSTGFRLTNHEYATARRVTEQGLPYVIRLITEWGTENQTVTDIPFETLCADYRIVPQNYRCVPRPVDPDTISGITYYRQMRCMTQTELSELVEMPQCDLSLYETGARKPSVAMYLRLSDALDATVDQLLAEYDASPRRERREQCDVN